MAVTHGTATRTALADAAVDRLDLGTGTAQGRLVFLTAANAVVATLNLSNPAFGAANGSGVATAAAITADSNAAGNASPVTQFQLRDRDGTTVIAGNVTATGGGGDIELSSTTIGAGDNVSVSSLTYTAPA